MRSWIVFIGCTIAVAGVIARALFDRNAARLRERAVTAVTVPTTSPPLASSPPTVPRKTKRFDGRRITADEAEIVQQIASRVNPLTQGDLWELVRRRWCHALGALHSRQDLTVNVSVDIELLICAVWSGYRTVRALLNVFPTTAAAAAADDGPVAVALTLGFKRVAAALIANGAWVPVMHRKMCRPGCKCTLCVACATHGIDVPVTAPSDKYVRGFSSVRRLAQLVLLGAKIKTKSHTLTF